MEYPAYTQLITFAVHRLSISEKEKRQKLQWEDQSLILVESTLKRCTFQEYLQRRPPTFATWPCTAKDSELGSPAQTIRNGSGLFGLPVFWNDISVQSRKRPIQEATQGRIHLSNFTDLEKLQGSLKPQLGSHRTKAVLTQYNKIQGLLEALNGHAMVLKVRNK